MSRRPKVRFTLNQYSHLGTAAVETDDDGGVITYEEFHPYGTTAWWAEKSGIQVSSKRYRYTGKEKDDETKLNYHNKRYYLSWLGRWAQSDPIKLQGGFNLFEYCSSNPINRTDHEGTDDTPVSLGIESAGGTAVINHLIEEGLLSSNPSIRTGEILDLSSSPGLLNVQIGSGNFEINYHIGMLATQHKTDPVLMQTALGSAYDGPPTISGVVGETVVGFSPAGFAADGRDIYSLTEQGEFKQAGVVGLYALLGGAGDLLKGIRRVKQFNRLRKLLSGKMDNYDELKQSIKEVVGEDFMRNIDALDTGTSARKLQEAAAMATAQAHNNTNNRLAGLKLTPIENDSYEAVTAAGETVEVKSTVIASKARQYYAAGSDTWAADWGRNFANSVLANGLGKANILIVDMTAIPNKHAAQAIYEQLLQNHPDRLNDIIFVTGYGL